MALEHRVDDTLVLTLYLPDILGVYPGPMVIFVIRYNNIIIPDCT